MFQYLRKHFLFIIFFNLKLNVLCLIVNEPCPDIEAFHNFTIPGSNFYRIFFHLPTDELNYINPLYFPNYIPLHCCNYKIDFQAGNIKIMLPEIEDSMYLLTFNYTLNSNAEYIIDYDHKTDCVQNVISNMKIIDTNNNDYFVFWTCKNLTNNQSVRGAIGLVRVINEFNDYYLNNTLKLLNVTRLDLRIRTKYGTCPRNFNAWLPMICIPLIHTSLKYYIPHIIMTTLALIIIAIAYCIIYKTDNRVVPYANAILKTN